MTRDRSNLLHDVDSLASALRRQPAGTDRPLFPPSTEKAGVESGETPKDDVDTLSQQILNPNPDQFPPSMEKAGDTSGEISDDDVDMLSETFPPSSDKSGGFGAEITDGEVATPEESDAGIDDLSFPPSSVTAGPGGEIEQLTGEVITRATGKESELFPPSSDKCGRPSPELGED